MTNQERVDQFVQDVYLVRFNKRLSSLTDNTGTEEVAKTLAFCRMFIKELESERNPDGTPVDWSFARTNDNDFGVISSASQIFELPDGVRRLVIDEDRPLVLMYDGSIITKFGVVEPNQITRRRVDPSIEDRVATVKRSLAFSRTFKDFEIGATVMADTIEDLPELSVSDVELLDMVPYQLLVLGTAKNSVRPDIVQGGLAPSFIEQYADELDKAIANNNATTSGDSIVYEDLSGIGGVY